MGPRQNQNTSNNNNSNDKSSLVPQGAHTARIVLIAFIGALEKTFKGQTKIQDTILVTFELTDEEREYQDEKYKMVITKEYSFNYASKGFFLRDIQAILARNLTDDEVNYNSEKLFDPTTLLDAPVTITVTHKPWEKNGKSGTNVEVASVSGVAEKLKQYIPAAQRTLINFDISKFSELSELKNDETFKKLNKFIKGKIEQTNDWKQLVEMDKHSNPTTDATPTTNHAPVNTTPITILKIFNSQNNWRLLC